MLNPLAEAPNHTSNIVNFKHLDQGFLRDVIQGLSKPQKAISPKYFYDTRGSQYFDEICELEEYYPYRTELKLLQTVADDLSKELTHPMSIVEFGAGSLKKIKPLLQALPQAKSFVPIDIAGDFLQDCAKNLEQSFPDLDVLPVVADFCQPVPLPKHHPSMQTALLGFFPGSTIGNFAPQEAQEFLHNARLSLGQEGYLLIGVDTKKSPSVLHRAYNDEQQVTAKFNLNLLERINSELEANFELKQFEHYAFYNTHKGCIEMHLVSQQQQEVCVADQSFAFSKGESIHTECSYKYNPDEFRQLAQQSGWLTQKSWLSDDQFFSVHLLRAC